MTEQQEKDAIEYIEDQLTCGYIDLSTHDECELEIVKEAINLWKTVNTWNNIPCTSFQLSKDDIQRAFKQMETESDYLLEIRERLADKYI